jgi:hypothetical protein
MVKHPMIQEKVGVAPHEMMVPAATDCRRASGCWHAHPYG